MNQHQYECHSILRISLPVLEKVPFLFVKTNVRIHQILDCSNQYNNQVNERVLIRIGHQFQPQGYSEYHIKRCATAFALAQL